MPAIKFNHLPDFINSLDDNVSRGLGQGAQAMADSASSKAPVDTGQLRDSIEAQEQGAMSWEVVADTDYAAAVELGTVRTAAQPYMLPAFDAEKDNVIEAIKEALS